MRVSLLQRLMLLVAPAVLPAVLIQRIAEVRRSGYAVLHKPVSPSVLQDAVGRALRAA